MKSTPTLPGRKIVSRHHGLVYLPFTLVCTCTCHTRKTQFVRDDVITVLNLNKPNKILYGGINNQ